MQHLHVYTGIGWVDRQKAPFNPCLTLRSWLLPGVLNRGRCFTMITMMRVQFLALSLGACLDPLMDECYASCIKVMHPWCLQGAPSALDCLHTWILHTHTWIRNAALAYTHDLPLTPPPAPCR